MKTIRLILMICLAAPTVLQADAIDDAIARAERPDKDRALDVARKPGAVLRFLGIGPGMAVFDIFAGGGYYTELLSYVVGDEGEVVLYNNQPWQNFVGTAVEERVAGGRLPNVEVLVQAPETLAEYSPGKFDAAIFVLGMHDIYYADEANGWVRIDREKFLEGIFSLLSDGGVLGIIDHNAEAGTDPSIVGQSVHRIDPAVVIRDVEAVGFDYVGEIDVLANPDDDKSMSVFDPAIQRKTDRSILKFRKPAS